MTSSETPRLGPSVVGVNATAERAPRTTRTSASAAAGSPGPVLVIASSPVSPACRSRVTAWSMVVELNSRVHTAAPRQARPAGRADHRPRRRLAGLAFPRLESLAGDRGCSLVIERHPAGRGGCFIPDLNLISLNEANSTNHQIKTLVHELSHALLRRADPDGLALTYSQEELVVESIALTVVGGQGLDTSGYSIPYLTSWSQNDHNLEIIETCAGIIDELAKRIEDAIGHPPADPSPAAQ
jgi:uncharacterized protein DUF6782